MTRIAFTLRNTKIDEYRVDWVNEKANEFYSLPPHSEELLGARVENLFELVRPWMRPDDFEKFQSDQKAARAQFEAEGFAVAKVPFRFTNSHPDKRYRDRDFLPIMSEVSEVEGDGQDRTLCAYVLYYELEKP